MASGSMEQQSELPYVLEAAIRAGATILRTYSTVELRPFHRRLLVQMTPILRASEAWHRRSRQHLELGKTSNRRSSDHG